MTRPNLLYISPVTPAPSGLGLAMRAYHNLFALAQCYAVHLVIIPTVIKPVSPDPSLFALCKKVVFLPIHPVKDFRVTLKLLLSKIRPNFISRYDSLTSEMLTFSLRRLKAAAKMFSGIRFDVIHAFRLYMYPYAFSFRPENFQGIIQLDLDDIESSTRRSLGSLFLVSGNKRMAQLMQLEAQKYEKIERFWLSRFDRLFTCSAVDREKIGQYYDCQRVEVVPNVVKVNKTRKEQKQANLFTFLLIGSFLYYPNLDGLLFFCDKVLPLIRQDVALDFALIVVGVGIPRKMAARLSSMKEVKLVGPVPDVEPFYEKADAAVVPIRAGGGTRIKVLEAMAYQLPLVSTVKGIEGLEVRPEVDVLLGDTPEAFAAQCCRIMTHPDLRHQLIKNAFSRVCEFYTLDKIIKVLCKNQGGRLDDH